ncbi:alpha-xylosidase [Actinobacteria bacterium YIM 96077]|uniref:alpha-D-xyloside xylohydrolase n=1 Tax=Phytoactinopolyspora halophila TaxID=1981511 RepID=A0A329QEM7_9ACTN|nr:alpha-xylosidase [Phytoactinopolyspora halophila]AYY13433.1 alpha-xylosidase [Actinobacteria bacterium YIM 96077]RAW10827.1 alpha-xylosidase [Phytoactinopolyspora halophila]
MKFTDGYWGMRPGVQALHPAEAYDVEPGDTGFTVYAPTRHIARRGDTLNRPLVTTRFSSPMPGVISVRLTHHAGGLRRPPHFELPGTGSPDVDVRVDDGAAELTSGDLTVRVRRGDSWRVDFLAGERVLTSSGSTGMGFMTTADGSHYALERLDLNPGDTVYGLGERFGPFVKNGQSVDIWNNDGGTASEQAYKNVPFYLTNAGYGIFVNHPGLVSFEVASEIVSRTQFSVEDQELEYFVIYGPTPKDILRRYTALTGRPAPVPAWSHGLWLSTSFTTDYDEATVSSFVDGMAERDIPLSVFHFDCFWMREFHWCDFEWDPRTFPDPQGMIDRLKDRGVRICLWINPYIAQRSHLFEEGKAKGYLVRRPDGSVWQWDNWQAGMALVDFTNPAARDWYASHLRRLLDMGVDTFKTDFGERIPTDVIWEDGSDPHRMHNYYTHLYNQTVFELLREHRGADEAVVFARSATAGGQRFPVHWGGDCDSTFASMAESLRGGLSLAMSGFGYWSHDIGGFENTPDPAVFKRWCAFGLLSSHSRLHGSGSYRVPWVFDDEATDVLRAFTKLKMRLMPYLAATARDVGEHGTPMMRPMVLEFPEDRATTHVELQYMLGDRLLVAPVMSAAGQVSYYVPDGTWTSLLDGSTVQGPRWFTQTHGFDSLPLLVRPDTVLPIGAVDDRPDYDYADGVTLWLYELSDGHDSELTIPDSTGTAQTVFSITRRGSTVTIRAAHFGNAPKPWQAGVAGTGTVVEAPAGSTELTLNL